VSARVVTGVLVALLLAGSAGAATPQGKLAARGYHLYGEYCASCHGPNAAGRVGQNVIGAGPGREQTQQNGIGPSLHGVGAIAADFYLRSGYMPLPRTGVQPRRGLQVLSEAQIRALVAYVASFGGSKIPQPKPQLGNLSEGEQLFSERCSGCHQIVGRGGYVTGAVAEPLEYSGIDATTIAEAVRIGPYVMPKFTEKDLNERQLDSVVRYVLWAQKPPNPGGWGIDFIGPVPEGLVTWFIALPILIGFCILLGRRLRA
jgi:ubiquinol-cytochrome c reductase cytochrome c subunit